MALDDRIPRLGCGRPIDEVWRTVNRPPDAHERSCRQCQSARASLRSLAEATRSLRHNDTTDPALRPRSKVKETIMNLVRAEVRRGSRLPLRRDSLGDIAISEQAIASLIRWAAAGIPGVNARRCNIELFQSPGPPGTGAPEPDPDPLDVAVNVRISVASGTPIPEAAALLRERITNALAKHVGVRARTIDVLVEDLHDV
jgi:uncharacterized alkaline shock family protein YloU